MIRFFLPLIAALFIAINTHAADRLEPADVSAEAMILETQRLPDEAGASNISLAWWVPVEFWTVTLSQDPTVNDALREQFLGGVKGSALLAVVQADISPFGAFKFYSLQKVRQNLTVERTANGEWVEIQPMNLPGADLSSLLDQLKPMLRNAMGQMGQNIHFFVFDDPADARVFDPYGSGQLRVRMQRTDGLELTALFEAPLDSLHVPRTCPSGKPAHISWSYCPWSGEKLP